MTKMTAIVDLQFGSTGKGLIAGYLSERTDFDTVVSANMPNAGHTFVDATGKKWINKVLPSGVYSNGLENIGLGPGAIFNPHQLALELDELAERTFTRPRIMIHENAALLFPHHKEREIKSLNHISSTMQGSCEAMIEKIRRQGLGGNTVGFSAEYLDKVVTSAGEKLSQFIVSAREWNNVMMGSKHILCEGSQGFSLGINAGFYPYCTSRDCTVWRLMADCAIPAVADRTVIGTARVHPIRVGNTENGNSGACYPDQHEISWSDLSVPPETTTVTGRVRRVFSFSEIQIREAVEANGIDQVFLNFCNYNPTEAIRVARIINFIGKVHFEKRGFGAWEGQYPQFVRYMGFGPASSDILKYDGYTQY